LWWRRQGGEPAPEIQIDPAAFVFHKTERLTICFFFIEVVRNTSRPLLVELRLCELYSTSRVEGGWYY
jgi:hypothetical protein